MLRSVLLVAAALLSASPAPAEPPPRTVVYIVRHGEKASEPRRNPGLKPDGIARAEALADALGGSGLTAIVTSQFARTQATAVPIARAAGVVPVVIRYQPGDFEEHGRAVAAAIRAKYVGGTVLVVGHSDTIPWIIHALGGPEMAQLCEATEYGSIFELLLAPDAPTAMERTPYGKPDPPLPLECRTPQGGTLGRD